MTDIFQIGKKNYFVDGGKINIDMLNRISNDTAESVDNINSLLYTPGVLFLPTNTSLNFSIAKYSGGNDGTNLTIQVGYIPVNSQGIFGGIAIDNNGHYVVISKNESYVGYTDAALNYNKNILNWSAPVRSTDPTLAQTDGSGPTGVYSRNSGNYNIPIKINDTLTAAQNTNYIYIKFVQVVAPTSSSSQRTSDGVNTFDEETQYISGYAIRVVNPYVDAELQNNFDAILKTEGYIKIGEVYLKNNSGNWDVDSVSTSNIPTPNTTQYAYFKGTMVGAAFEGITGYLGEYPTVPGDYISLYTHINAIGTGPVSATNPHGLTATDLGIEINNTGVTQATTISADNVTVYDYSHPLLDLSDAAITASYDTILVDANLATNGSTVVVRLPEANLENISKNFTIKRIDSNTAVNVYVTTTATGGEARTDNLIDNNLANSSGFSTYQLRSLGETSSVSNESNSATFICARSAQATNSCNWYTINRG